MQNTKNWCIQPADCGQDTARSCYCTVGFSLRPAVKILRVLATARGCLQSQFGHFCLGVDFNKTRQLGDSEEMGL